MSIQKSQVQTLDKIVVDLGKKETSLGITFVALSNKQKKINNFGHQKLAKSLKIT